MVAIGPLLEAITTAQDASNYATLRYEACVGMAISALVGGHASTALNASRATGRPVATGLDRSSLLAKPRNHPKAAAPTRILDR